MAISDKNPPKSSHLSDPSLAPFLQPTFTPAAYLNSTLPSFHLATTPAQSRPQSSVPLADLSAQTQTLLSQLNAQATRLSNALNQLTEEILRSGGRLSYEVDVLKGEVQSLGELMNDGLKEDVQVFVPGGLSTVKPAAQQEEEEQAQTAESQPQDSQIAMTTTASATTSITAPTPKEPPELENLRTLTHVRQNLDGVISLFGSALSFPLPPSLLNPQSGNSFISVSAPAGREGGEDTATLERKGQEYITALKAELLELINRDAGEGELKNPRAGAEEARKKVQDLRDLCGVWKGTAEEKARVNFVEGLAAFVEEKIREIEGAGSGNAASRSNGDRSTASPRKRAGTQTRREAEKGSGFLENLRGIRG